jgi:hypothetical protein
MTKLLSKQQAPGLFLFKSSLHSNLRNRNRRQTSWPVAPDAQNIILDVGPKTDEVTGEWRKSHSGELHHLYSPPDIIRQIKSGRMMWAGHVAA